MGTFVVIVMFLSKLMKYAWQMGISLLFNRTGCCFCGFLLYDGATKECCFGVRDGDEVVSDITFWGFVQYLNSS